MIWMIDISAMDDLITNIDRQPSDDTTPSIETLDRAAQDDPVDEKFEVPDSTANQTYDHEVVHTSMQDDANHDHVSLIFRDGLDLPLVGLDFIVTLPSGLVCTATSTSQGAITVPVSNDRVGQARVEVKDETGQHQQVCSIDLARCKSAVIINSGKVKAVLPLRPHQQTPPAPTASTGPAHNTTKLESLEKTNPSEPWWSANGALAQAWSRFIGSNAASGKPPVTPAMTPLAGKMPEQVPKLDPKGNPLKDQKGKVVVTIIRELWNANAGNAQSGAAGLTQFLASTWLNHIQLPGYLRQYQRVAKGWGTQEAAPKSGKRWVFVLADGKTTI